MRDHVRFWINGTPQKVGGADVFWSLSDFLRRRLDLVGTKIVCSEGDCGACSVLVGRVDAGGRWRYPALDACIQFLYQLDGTHVVTVEGLSRDASLHPVQDALVRCHGSQCGFCTPGFVVTLAGQLEARSASEASDALDIDEIRDALTGNLCRCTGYVQIVDACASIDPRVVARLGELYPEEEIAADLRLHRDEAVQVDAVVDGRTRTVFIPVRVEDAVEFKNAEPASVIVSGATDLGVLCNKRRIEPTTILCLGRVESFTDAVIDAGRLECGAGATWSTIERCVEESVPQLHAVLDRFGSSQIRNAATIGGNLANASPIADSLPFLFVLGAEIELVGASGTRRVGIEDFYLGYKKIDLRPDEIIARVSTPLPTPGEELELYKVSRRRDLDISTFTAAVLVREENGRIENARIAYGGVGPVVVRLPAAEAVLVGRPFTEETFLEAGRVARTEIAPISDVRGSAAFRLQLAENILLKFYHDRRGGKLRAATVGAGGKGSG
jgi:xanthine dehydrogenase small subunit